MQDVDKRLLLELVGSGRASVELPRQGVLSIGSGREKADFWVDGQGVAEVHCAIGRLKGGGWALKDLGSEYGTLLNGAPIQSQRLEAGDLIVIGSRRLRVVDPSAPKPAPPPQASETLVSSSNKSAPAPEAPLSGPAVRGYRVGKLLGKGGMGEVYLAVQERLERQVALKLLSRALSADAAFVARFLAEARAAAALNHPNVVVVYDAGEDDGHHFLSMEFMEHGNLESRVQKEGALPWKQALQILIEAARGLAYAESRGIVHRDIKPANLMQNEQGATKIADLGLAAHLDAEATEADSKKIFGTPHFISPEQARGERVDARSDLYSLGATAYRLLSGRTPFEGATTRDILRGHFTEEPKSLREIVPSLPSDLATAVHRLLKKKPEERYQKASELLLELERIQGGRPALGPAQVVEARRSRAPLVVGVLVLVAALAGLAWWQQGQSKLQGDELADRPRVDQAPHDPPKPIEEPALVDLPTPPKNVDDDAALQILEYKAEIAFRDVPKDLEPVERRAKLLQFAGQYPGTTAAGKAIREAAEIAARLESQANVAQGVVAQASRWIAELDQADRQAGDDGQLGPALDALQAVPLPDPIPPEVAEHRRKLMRGRLARALPELRRELEASTALGERGEYEALESELRRLADAATLTGVPLALEGDDLADLPALQALAEDARARIEQIPLQRAGLVQKRAREDARTIAGGLGGPSGLEAELAALDLRRAEARLASIEGQLVQTENREWARQLRGELAAARSVLETLGSEFARGAWRRRTIADPRPNKGGNRNVVLVDAGGVVLEGESEALPWSAFGARPRELHQLFHERLARDWSPAERRAIGALLRLTAVAAATSGASEMLVPNTRSKFTEGEQREVLDGYAFARVWLVAGDLPLLDAELSAASDLTAALRHASEGRWVSSTELVERLLLEGRETLLVRLLSGGPVNEGAAEDE